MDNKKTHWKNLMNYNYIGSHMVIDQDLVLTIKEAKVQKLKNHKTNKEESKLCLYFQEINEGMVLNATNCSTIESLYSPFIEEWIGYKINIYSKIVKAFGEEHDALRIREFAPYKKERFEEQLKLSKRKADILFLIRICPHITSKDEILLQEARDKYNSLKK